MNPTPNPLPASEEGAMMYLITAGSAVCNAVNSIKKLKIVCRINHILPKTCRIRIDHYICEFY
jgi:hypothetical protein